jgi:cyclopropane fatty-acyl-phospholipid synthase-like methyltransferase
MIIQRMQENLGYFDAILMIPLAKSRDFSGFRSLVDVGGGSGGLAIAMAEAWPNLSITIADLPAIVPVAQRYIDEGGFATRMNVCPTNVVNDPLGGSYDVAVMRGLFPVLTRDQIRSALANVYPALKPGSPLYVVGWILDDTAPPPCRMRPTICCSSTTTLMVLSIQKLNIGLG